MNKIIEKTIEINSKPENVWRVFSDSETTKKMGGSYVSDWKIGSSFGWHNNDGEVVTRGEIIEIEPKKLLKHKLFNANKKSLIDSIITYEFVEVNGRTILKAKEELNYSVSEKQFEEIMEGWNIALDFVKNIAEKL